MSFIKRRLSGFLTCIFVCVGILFVSNKAFSWGSANSNIYYDLTGGISCSQVPSEYEELEYITIPGGQLIDTGVAGVPSTWELRAQYVYNTNYNGFMILLARDTSQQTYFGNLQISYRQNERYWGAGTSGGEWTDVAAATDSTIIVNFASNQIDGTVDGQSFIRTGSANSNYNYKLFSYNNNFYFQGKLWYAHGTIGNTTVNLVPARRKSDNAVGLYDTVGRSFKENLGSGTFGAGPVVAEDACITNYAGAPTTHILGTASVIDGVPTRDGYDFAGWCTDAELQDCAITQTIDASVMNDTTLYAKWTVATRTVTYSCGTGTGTTTDSNSPYNAGATVTAVASTCTPPANSVFTGWSCDGNTVAVGGTFTISSDTTCTAQYSECTACAATNASCSLTVVNNTCTYTTSCNTGYGNIQNNGAYNATCSLSGYNINYNLGCSQVPSEYEELEYVQATGAQSVDIGVAGVPSTWELRAQTTNDSSRFMILLARGTSQQTYFGVPNQNHKWGAGPNSGQYVDILSSTEATMTINFSSGQVDGTINGQSFVRTGSANLNTNYKLFSYNNDFWFQGKLWYAHGTIGNTTVNLVPARRKSDNAVGLYDTVGKSFKENSTATPLTAGPVVNDNNSCATNYVGAPTTYIVGTGATINGTPTRDGYDFAGWCTDAELQNCAASQTIGTNETGDKTFYAKWNETSITYTVTYACGTGTGTTTDSNSPYNAGATVTAVASTCTPPANSVFTGWSCDGNTVAVGGTFTISSDTTCTAQYSECTACAATNASCSLTVVNNTCTYTTSCNTGYGNIQNNGAYNASCSLSNYNINYDLTGGESCSVLPSEYEELEYVQATGAQSVDIGVAGVPSTWELHTQMTSNNYTRFMILLGRGTSQQTFFGVPQTNKYWGAGTNSGEYTNIPATTDSTMTINFSSGQVDGTINGQSFVKTGSANLNTNYKLFSYNNDFWFQGKLWYAHGTIGNTTVNLVPARRKSDNAVGLYDTVGKSFKENSTATPLTAGPVVSNNSTCITNYVGAPTTYTYGTGATINGTPTREGYTFGGWCTDSELQSCAMSQTIGTNATGDKTFYAKWIELFECLAGTYLPANSSQCTACSTNNYCSGGSYQFNANNNQGITACANGLFAPAGMSNANQCGRILHVGNSSLYLRSSPRTTPSLNIQIGNNTYYGNMTTTQSVMSNGSSNNLMLHYNNTTYYVCDDSVTTCN